MKTQHTPGEWAYDDREIYSEQTDHGAAICTINTTSAHFTDEEVRANARLVAAAPELLDALQSITETLHQMKQDDTVSGMLYVAELAIQKATQP